MRNLFLRIVLVIIILIFLGFGLFAQVSNYPKPLSRGTTVIKNATVHIGKDDLVKDNANLVIKDGKIISISSQENSFVGTDALVIDGTGKHVYPGLILTNSQIGLREIASIRATLDEQDVGEFNPNVRSIVAYNTDSRFIHTIRDNGILLANIVPQGGVISGRSSLVQLDAWNWEDALYKEDVAIHFYMPSLVEVIHQDDEESKKKSAERYEANLSKIEKAMQFFRQAKSYSLSASNNKPNLKFEGMRKLFSKQQKLFVHCNWVKEMLFAVEMANEFDIDVVIVGGYDSWKITDMLKKYNIAVVLEGTHQLPALEDDHVKQPFLTPSLLQKAGILFTINSENTHDRGRNLAYQAGTASTYGLTQEQALQALTFNAAKILGVDRVTGSLEVGKDANIILVEGDVLDMKSSTVVEAFIQGRRLSLDNVHKELERRFKHKYNL